jgi:hypothetical protein
MAWYAGSASGEPKSWHLCEGQVGCDAPRVTVGQDRFEVSLLTWVGAKPRKPVTKEQG